MNTRKDVTSWRLERSRGIGAGSALQIRAANPASLRHARSSSACERASEYTTLSARRLRHARRCAEAYRSARPEEEGPRACPSANMFRDGQYLEVIKASDDCVATAVVTVQERTVEIEKRKVTTNKWLQVEDWAALYKILERAILRYGRRGDGVGHEGREWRKSTRQLEVTYTFEHPDVPSLPTIKVHVSPARKKPVKRKTAGDETSKRNKEKIDDDAMKQTKEDKFPVRTITKDDRLKKTPKKSTQIFSKKTETPSASVTEQRDLKKKKCRTYTLSVDPENALLEEYIPDAPKTKGMECADFKYVPSRKSALENMRLISNEYTPTLCDGKNHVAEDVSYIPNSIEKLKTTYEVYEPCATTVIPDGIFEEYVPNSKGFNSAIEEYEPDFKSPSKLRKFDDSYVPSSVQRNTLNDSKKIPSKSAFPKKSKMRRLEVCRKRSVDKKKMDLFS
ncbi:uncharacterized protein LOC105835140 [Monomorium pharaonis]|uniref:uncharacterized protein LOC105835140 n=1 Tax=Monomorium pharaonis TaxID=307658 RepID=UPI001746FE72|nr:uncharacterized protein LOC105835140 [Monomorium pharaonis]